MQLCAVKVSNVNDISSLPRDATSTNDGCGIHLIVTMYLGLFEAREKIVVL